MSQTAVVIMAKAPQPGTVKTRLCPPLQPQTAARLYDAFLRDKVAQVRQLTHTQPTIAYTPDESRDFFAALAPGFSLIPQHGPGLGERLAHCFMQCFDAGCTSVVIVDSDTPHLPLDFLQQAVQRINDPRHDVVIGPSEDGGYYLIGLRTLHRELFEHMPWSTEVVAAETQRRAEAKGLRIAWLPPWFDIDTAADLQRLQRLLAASDALGPQHTRAFFQEYAS